MFLVDFINDVYSYCFVSANDILLCLALGVSFTILRYFLTEAVFKVRVRFFCSEHACSDFEIICQFVSVHLSGK